MIRRISGNVIAGGRLVNGEFALPVLTVPDGVAVTPPMEANPLALAAFRFPPLQPTIEPPSYTKLGLNPPLIGHVCCVPEKES